jgi:hypothetical protein
MSPSKLSHRDLYIYGLSDHPGALVLRCPSQTLRSTHDNTTDIISLLEIFNLLP